MSRRTPAESARSLIANCESALRSAGYRSWAQAQNAQLRKHNRSSISPRSAGKVVTKETV